MKNGTKRVLLPLAAVLIMLSGATSAQNPKANEDVFNGKLFAPNVILEHRDALELTEQQLAAIRAAVIDVQSSVAEHQWDMQEAYQRVLSTLDDMPIDEQSVLEDIDLVLTAENEVKKLQIGMLISLRNLLTDEQVAHLRSVIGQ